MDKSSGAPELHFSCLTLALHIAWAFIEACSVVSSEQTAGRFSWLQEFWSYICNVEELELEEFMYLHCLELGVMLGGINWLGSPHSNSAGVI